MTRSFYLILPLALALLPASAPVIDGVPQMTAVVPDSGRPGDLLTVEGKYLGPSSVVELYLTDGTDDWKCQIVEQSEAAIRFRIPAKIAPGRFRLMVLTPGPRPMLIEEPVQVRVL